jgi:HAE1 family hydrophobic/amphiphilic exporter-1
MDGLKSVLSQSYEGVSVLIVEFRVGADIDQKQQDAQRFINNMLNTLPEDAEPPSITKVSPSDQPILELMIVSKLGARETYDLVENEILPQIQQIKGIGETRLIGGEKREIQVNVDKDKLSHYGISLKKVTDAVNFANLDFPTGKVKDRDDQITVRLAGKFSKTNQIEELIVASPNGSPVRVRDVATVIDATKDQSSISRFNGQEGISISIKKQSDANAVAISEELREKILTIENKYGDKGLSVIIADDTSEFTLEAANAVSHDLMIAVVLVAAVMLLFLHSLRDSLIVLIAIPASLLSTFIAMYLFGYSLNLMTLLAMSLVIGILVDDSIVVLENIHRHLHMGKNRVQAAIDGRKEIGFSALAITMVDVVVFFPIALINTMIGDVLRQYSVTIVVSTLMSLFVCYTITPWLASRFGQVTHLSKDNFFHRFLLAFEKMLQGLTNWYTRQLKWTLNHKAITTVCILVAFVATGVVMRMGILGQEMVASGDRGKLLFKLEYDKKTSLTENNIRTLEIENYLLSLPDVKNVFSNVGGASTSGVIATVGSENKAEISVALVPVDQRKYTSTEIMLMIRKELESRYAGLQVNSVVQGITRSDEPIQIVLNSEDKNELMKASAQLENLISRLPGANDVSVSVEDGSPELTIELDREKMASLGLSVQQIGGILQNAYTGNTDAKFREGNNEYDINVRLDQFDRDNPADVENITFVNDKGELIPLRQFATIRQSSGPSMLERKDRRASVTIKSNVLGVTSGTLANSINAAMVSEPLPASVEMKWTGDIERQADSFSALGLALLTAVILVYLVMVVLYDSFVYPFVVLFSVPVALIGALIALNLAMSTLSIFTMLGIIMLIGLVLKNGILIVDFANHRKRDGLSTFDALIDAGAARLRPILMTTIAMVIGMLPIALAGGAGAEWKNGLAIVMIGGLLSSLMLTVFVVPMAFEVADNMKAKFEKMRAHSKRHSQANGLHEVQTKIVAH